eukprot:76742-Rhodomonas_salina.4
MHRWTNPVGSRVIMSIAGSSSRDWGGGGEDDKRKEEERGGEHHRTSIPLPASECTTDRSQRQKHVYS